MSLYLPKHVPGLADAVTEDGRSKLAVMIQRARSYCPTLIAIDLIDMKYRGCECMLSGIGPMDIEKTRIAEDLTAQLPHHVDLVWGTPGWKASAAAGETWAEKRADIMQWCMLNCRSAYNEFRTCTRDDLDVAITRVWRWAFADYREAVVFKLRWA
jgi:hypothetical protein